MSHESQINQSVLNRFSILAKAQRLAHAYLFIGPLDIGKGETAIAVAKMIHCSNSGKESGCDACPTCLKIKAGTHPDVYTIDNGYRETITIEQIRVLLGKDRLKPFSGPRKVFIIRNIENMTIEGANAFLKTLEEPTASSLLLLTTSVSEKNLDTVRSRCQAVYFPPQARRHLAGRLKQEYRLNDTDAHFLAYFAEGCPGRARRLMDAGAIRLKDAAIEQAILTRPSEAYIKEILVNEERTKDFLDILSSWLRDAVLLQSRAEDQQLIHWGRRRELGRFVENYTLEELNGLNQAVMNMYRQWADHLNVKLPLLIIGEQLWEK